MLKHVKHHHICLTPDSSSHFIGVSKMLPVPTQPIGVDDSVSTWHQCQPIEPRLAFGGWSPFRCRCNAVTGSKNPSPIYTEPNRSQFTNSPPVSIGHRFTGFYFNFFLMKWCSMGVIKKKKRRKTMRFNLGFQILKSPMSAQWVS